MKKVTDLTETEVIVCRSLEETRAIFELFNKAGLTWAHGSKYERPESYFNTSTGTWAFRPATGSHSGTEWYLAEGFTLHEAKEFLTQSPVQALKTVNEMKTDFKFGDKVVITSVQKGSTQKDAAYGVITNELPNSLGEITVRFPHNYYVLNVADIAPYGGNTNTDAKELKAALTKTISVKGVEREVTVVVLINNGEVRSGYSVRIPEDKHNKELAEKIAKGRALNDKTNLTTMLVGLGMDKKFILYAIAEDLLRKVSEGKIEIKGVKAPKVVKE